MSQQCEQCGSALDPGAVFCGACGAEQHRGKPAQPPTPPAPPAPDAGTVHTGAERFSPLALVGAGLTLAVLFATLFVLGNVVHDANAEQRETDVLPGKVSVVGAAKVRDWSTAGLSGFTIQIPAGWSNIATGLAKDPKTGEEQENNVVHVWHGRRDEPVTPAACDKDVACLRITVNRRRDDKGRIASAEEAARLSQCDAQRHRSYKYRDLGPVTTLGGRRAWRWVFDQRDLEKITYFFNTMADGKRDALWTVQTWAPAGTYADQQFATTLNSLTTVAESEPIPESRSRSRDGCSAG